MHHGSFKKGMGLVGQIRLVKHLGGMFEGGGIEELEAPFCWSDLQIISPKHGETYKYKLE